MTEPGLYPNRSYIDQTGFEQIDTYTRALRLSFVDVHLPGNGGFDLKLYRNYDSRGKDNSQQSRPFTHGWSMHMGYVQFSASGSAQRACIINAGDVQATLHTPQGETANLIQTELIGNPSMFTNRWKVDCNRTTVSKLVLIDTEGSVYEMTLQIAYTQYYFMTTRITDRNGNWAAVTYAPPYNYTAESQPFISGITTSDGRVVSFAFEPNNLDCIPDTGVCNQRLKSVTAAGQTHTYQYCSNDPNKSMGQVDGLGTKLVSVTRPDSRQWKFAYHQGATGFCDSRSLSEGSINPALFDGNKRQGLTQVVTPFGGETNYTFSSNWSYSELPSNPDGQPNYWQLDTKRNARFSTGRWTFSSSFGYHNGIPAAVVTVVAPEGTSVYKYGMPSTNSFWQHGLLLMKQSGSLQTETYTYIAQRVSDKWHLGSIFGVRRKDYTGSYLPILTSKTILRDGAAYQTSYANHDIHGNPQTITESGPNGGNRITNRSYYIDTAKWIIHKPKDESFPGSSMLHTYDANANLISQNANGIVTSHSYDVQGNLSSTNFPGNKLHTYSNYYRGIARTENQPEGINLYRAVSDAGNITSETNGEGHITSFAYDGLNRLTYVQRPLGAPVNISYATNSRTAVRGGLVDYEQYDGFGRMTYQAAGGVARHYTYDATGRLIYQSNPGNASVGTGFAYDILNRKTAISHPDGSTAAIGYGPGYLVEYNERGTYTVRYFKAYGNPDNRFDYYIATPIAASSLSIARNAVDQITAVSQGGLTRSYGYNAAYQLTGLSDPEIGYTGYGRDAAGNMTYKQTTLGGTIYYYYDGQNRLYNTTPPDGSAVVSNYYNRNNRLTWTVNATASKSYVYDANGNVTGEGMYMDGQSMATGYCYNELDAKSCAYYGPSNRYMLLNPDVLGRPQHVGGFVNTLSYFPSGQIYSIAHANGVNSYYGQNPRLWPASHVVTRGSTALVSNAYTYDGTGNATAITDYIGHGYGRTFGYDAIDRLTTATGPWGTGAVTYDGRGNITGQSFGNFSVGYYYHAPNNAMQATYVTQNGVSKSSYPSYNYAGHMTWDGTNQFTFNALDQLTCAACNIPGFETRHGYDGFGQRVWTQKGTAPKTYEFHSQDGKLLMEWQSGAGGFLREHIYAGPRRIAEVHTPVGQAANITHAHPDPAGSPALITDASGLVASREQYRPYGGKLISPNSNDSAGFAGKPFDAATGLSYMSARYYNPTLGRFISPDPVHFVEGNIHSFNRFAYANNNPMRYIDPTGMEGDAISETGKTETPQEEQVAGLGKAFGAIGRALGIGTKQGAKQATEEAVKKETVKDLKELTKEQQKSIQSLQKQIDNHQKKLDDFKTSPTVRPGMENLPKEMIEQQQKARMEHLTKEMQTFRDNISKIQNGVSK